MKMVNLSKALMAAGLMTAAAAAQAGVTGNVAFTTDYLFRGVSQSSNNAAIQGTMSYAHESGVYVTAWGSSIASSAGGLELDTLLGYAGKAGDVSYDVGVMRYNYPGLNENTGGYVDASGNPVDTDYNEVYASVSFAGAKFGLNYSPDYFAESDKFLYSYLDYSKEVAGIGLFAHVGWNKFDDEVALNQALGGGGLEDDYLDYKFAVSKTVEGVVLELAYVGSDIESDTLLAAGVETGVAEDRAVFTVTKAF
jgi:uncharacterized protein (TIGR02001 family)